MEALYFEETGNAVQVLKKGIFNKPIPQPGEVIVRMMGSTINPADVIFIKGNYRFKPEFPQIAGLEGAGLVESTGEGVDIPTGTLVSFLTKNTWAEYVAVHQNELFILPLKFPLEKAAQFTLNPFTAWGLLERAALKAGDWLLLSAGNSAVARQVAQMAIIRNIKVIATVRKEAYIKPLASLGIAVINIGAENLTERVNQITNGDGVMCVMDPVGGKTGTELLKCLKLNGKYIIYGVLDPNPVQFHNSTIIYKNLSISAFGIRDYINSKNDDQRAEILQALITVVGSPGFKMDVAASYHLNDFQAAIEKANYGTEEGKVLFIF